ncbi:dTMP kinase [Kineosporia babensis]
MIIELRPHGMPGLLVAIEGPDGSGKTTLEEVVESALRRRGLSSVLTQQPTRWWRDDPKVAETRRNPDEGLSPMALALFSLADRFEHQVRVVEPALLAGRPVLTNRYVFSLLTHFMVEGDLDLDALRPVLAHLLRPDLLIVLDAPTHVLLERVIERDGSDPRRWDQQRAYVERSREAYVSLASRNGGHVLRTDRPGAARDALTLVEELLLDRRGSS